MYNISDPKASNCPQHFVVTYYSPWYTLTTLHIEHTILLYSNILWCCYNKMITQ